MVLAVADGDARLAECCTAPGPQEEMRAAAARESSPTADPRVRMQPCWHEVCAADPRSSGPNGQSAREGAPGPTLWRVSAAHRHNANTHLLTSSPCLTGGPGISCHLSDDGDRHVLVVRETRHGHRLAAIVEQDSTTVNRPGFPAASF